MRKQILYVLTMVIFLSACQSGGDENAELHQAILASGRYLENAIQEDGSYEYAVHLDSTYIFGDNYNIVRHAAATHAMNEFYHYHKDRSLVKKLIKTMDYMNEHTLRMINNNPEIQTYFNMDRPGQVGQVADLGAAGLGLCAAAGFEKIKPGTTSPETLAAIANFISLMQNEDGSYFYHYYTETGKLRDSPVIFYPGEACLGVLYLYEVQPDPKWKEVAEKTLNYISEKINKEGIKELDHWFLIATGKFLSIFPDHPNRQDYVMAATEMCEEIVYNAPAQFHEPNFQGALQPTGSTTGTATRLEALTAFYPYIPDERESFRSRTWETMERAIDFLIRSMVKEGPYKGGMTRYAPRTNQDQTTLLPAEEEIRIDFVQHAMMAMIQFDRLQE